MIKALVLTTTFPPLEATSVNRVKSWRDHFNAHGIRPLFLTRHWNASDRIDDAPNDPRPRKLLREDGYDVLYLPIRKSPLGVKLLESSVTSKLAVFWGLAAGGFGSSYIKSDFFRSVDYELKTLAPQENFDIVLVTAPDGHLIRTAYKLRKKYGIPFVVDFRDPPGKSFHYGERPHFSDQLLLYRPKRWTRLASGVVSVGPNLLGTIVERLAFKGPKAVVYNGFDKEFFAQAPRKQSSKFELTFYGTIYDYGDKESFELILSSVSSFLGSLPAQDRSDVLVNLLGIYRNMETQEIGRKHIPESNLKICERLARDKLILMASSTSVFLLPGFPKLPGCVGTRVFEYLAIGAPVLLAPRCDDTLDEIVRETNCGSVVSSREEIQNVIEKHYEEWRSKGMTESTVNEVARDSFTRKNQAAKLAKFLKDCMHAIPGQT